MKQVLAFMALAALYLVVFGYRNGDFMDSDEGIFGLMARHIVYRHELPVYYWGQEYLGAFESYLVAPLIWIFGSHALCMRAITILFYLSFIPAAADVAFMAGGRRLAWITAAVLATPPVAYTVWATKMHTFTEAGEASFVSMWLAIRFVRAQQRRTKFIFAALLGLAVGVGFWWSYLTIVYVIPATLIILLHPDGRAPKAWAIAIAMFIVGASPALYRNAFVTHWATFVHAAHPDASQAAAGQPDHAVPAQAIENLKTIALPAFLGFHDARVRPYQFNLPAGLIHLLLCFLALAGATLTVMRVADRSRPLLTRLAAAAPLAGGLVMIALYVFSRFGFEREPRYVMPLYLAVGCANAWAVERVFRWRPAAGATVMVAIAAYMTWGTFFVEKAVQVAQWNPDAPAVVTWRPAAQRLIALGVHHVRADYWTSVRLSFDSDEQIVAVDRNDRNPEMAREVADDPHACYLAAAGPQMDRMSRQPNVIRYDLDSSIPGLGIPQVVVCPK